MQKRESMKHEHFRELKEWSERKHELVLSYLKGFVRILGGSTKGIVYYIDGFAGPGIYEDGSKGSPIRAAEYTETLFGKHYQLYCINVEVDPVHSKNLGRSTAPYQKFVTNYKGTFGDHVDTILSRIESRPAIFFLDPFGLKGVEWKHINPMLKRSHITEVLLRINPKDISRLAGFACSDSSGAVKKCQILTDLYGFPDSERWVEVWRDKGIQGLVDLYIKRLLDATLQDGGKSYVCSYAIRSIEGQLKYHLIFTTRHPKGAILMSDIIHGREKCYERDVKDYERECLE